MVGEQVRVPLWFVFELMEYTEEHFSVRIMEVSSSGEEAHARISRISENPMTADVDELRELTEWVTKMQEDLIWYRRGAAMHGSSELMTAVRAFHETFFKVYEEFDHEEVQEILQKAPRDPSVPPGMERLRFVWDELQERAEPFLR